jgi:hypothetical protein
MTKSIVTKLNLSTILELGSYVADTTNDVQTFFFLSCSHLVFNILLLFISISNLIKIILNIISRMGEVKEGGSY